MKNIILIAEEYPSHPGGVAHFSRTLANTFHKRGELKAVISLSSYAPVQEDFQVCWINLARRKPHTNLDKYVFIRKAITVYYRLYAYLTNKLADPVGRILNQIEFRSAEDVLFFTYQVHFPDLVLSLYRRYKCRYQLLYHGLDLIDGKEYHLPIQQAVDYAEKVFFNSNATARLFTKLGYTCKNYEVVYPTLDTDYLASLELMPIDDLEERFGIELKGKKIIVSVCRLVKRKGIHFAIDMICNLHAKGHEFVYLVVGTGPEQEALQEQATRLGLSDTVHFLGYVTDLEKYSLLNAAQIYLMPNYDDGGRDFEGFGISFLEAGHFGNYVIGGNHGGASEALNLIENAYKFSFSESTAIHQAETVIEDIITNLNAENSVEQLYDLEKNLGYEN